jgi:hypothetical protein
VTENTRLVPIDEELTDGDLARLAKRYARESLACLILAIRSEDADLRIRVTAATELLTRGFGRAAQAAPLPQYLSPDDLRRMIIRAGGEDPAR